MDYARLLSLKDGADYVGLPKKQDTGVYIQKVFKKFTLAALILLLQGLLSLPKGITFFVFIAKGPLGRLYKTLLMAVALPIYRSYLAARRSLAHLPAPVQQGAWYFLFYRSLVQGVVILVALLVTANNIQASGGIGGEEVGRRSMLFALLNSSDEDLVEETAEENNVNSAPRYINETDSTLAIDIYPDFEEQGEDNDYSYSETADTFLKPDNIINTQRTRTEQEIYEVRPGDTISSIAELFGVSINTVLWENNLTVRSTIRPEQKLVVLPSSGITHKVVRGDTVAKIAARYKTTVEKVLEFNDGLKDGLKAGDKIFIPDGIKPPPPPPPPRRLASPKTILIPTAPPDLSAKFVWPTAASRITQYFHWRHPGVDIAGPNGSPLYATDDGIVEYAGWGKGYGLQVIVNHGNGMRSRYAHSSKLVVKKGDQVTKGQTLALMGSTGRSTGPHIHFELYINGKRVNPLDYIRK